MWGYTLFPLNNKGKFCVGVHSFFPLYKGCSSCVSNNPGIVFSLNIRDDLPNSVDLFESICGPRSVVGSIKNWCLDTLGSSFVLPPIISITKDVNL